MKYTEQGPKMLRLFWWNGDVICYISFNFLSLCVSVCLSVSPSLYLSVSLCFPLSLSLSPSSLEQWCKRVLGVCLSPPSLVSPPPPPRPLSLYVCMPVSLPSPLRLSFCLSALLSVCLSVSLSLPLSLPLSPPPPPPFPLQSLSGFISVVVVIIILLIFIIIIFTDAVFVYILLQILFHCEYLCCY